MKIELILRNSTCDWVSDDGKTAIARGFGYISIDSEDAGTLQKGDVFTAVLNRWQSKKTGKTYFFAKIEKIGEFLHG